MARLLFLNGPYAGKSVSIPDNKVITLGRNRDIELPLPDLKLSRRHCQIEFRPTGFLLRDLGSTNGTYLNSTRIQGEVALGHGDHVVLGDTEIEFQNPEELDKAQTRVGVPAAIVTGSPMPPSAPAPLPILDAEAPVAIESELVETMPARSAPLIQAPASAGTNTDGPLLTALEELDLPLPHLNGTAAGSATERAPELLFCDACDVSIPILDLELGVAKELNAKIYCRECLAKGVTVGPEVPRSNAASSSSTKQIDDMLKGLDEAAEMVVEEAPRRSGQRNVAEPAPKPPSKPSKTSQELDDMLNEGFEEIEEIKEEVEAAPEPLPGINSGPQRAQPKPPSAAPRPAPKPVAPVKPAPPKPKPPAIDDDLIEIGDSGP